MNTKILVMKWKPLNNYSKVKLLRVRANPKDINYNNRVTNCSYL
jgi:hypothetical protein